MATTRYIAATSHDSDKLRIYDVTNPASVSLVGEATNSELNTVQAVIKIGDYLLTGSGAESRLCLFDISDLENPTLVDNILDIDYSNIQGFMYDGTYIYASARDDDFFIVLSINETLGTIVVEGELDGTVGAEHDQPWPGVFSSSGDYLYVGLAGAIDGVGVMDIRNPAAPVVNGEFDLAEALFVYDVARNGDKLFLGNFDGIISMELTNETTVNTTILQELTVPQVDDANQLTLLSSAANRLAGCGRNSSGTVYFFVLDISNPANMSVVGSVAIPAEGYSMALSDDEQFAYIACFDDNTLQIIDMSNLASPSIEAEIDGGLDFQDLRGVTYWEVSAGGAGAGAAPTHGLRVGVGLGL